MATTPGFRLPVDRGDPTVTVEVHVAPGAVRPPSTTPRPPLAHTGFATYAVVVAALVVLAVGLAFIRIGARLGANS